MNIYQEHLDQLTKELKSLNLSDRRTSGARLLTLIATGLLFYQGFQTENFLFYLVGTVTLVTFLLLIKKHQTIRWESKLSKSKIEVNEQELAFLIGKELPFESGEEFAQSDHPYSYDLDFFGPHSIFQVLNRTGTVRGKQLLADGLLHIQSKDEIIDIQEAVKELQPQIAWRQHLLALGRIDPDTPEHYQDIIDWSKRPPNKESSAKKVFSYLIPGMTLISLGLYLFGFGAIFGNITFLLFLVNVGILGLMTKTIREELIPSTQVEVILRHYALLLEQLENQSFQSSKLIAIQQSILSHDKKASVAIHQLSLLFGRMEHVANVFASPLLNGFLQYHVHVLRQLSKWRADHALHISTWLDAIGEVEKLSSLANFSYNNPEFVFPAINESYQIEFTDLGHPLLAREKAVTNSISFNEKRFFILTGSNMSGKSTFLRAAGVNMVLAGIGAPVFATSGNVHPLPVVVSMRLSDSLTDSESYFYAEVKRLKWIMDHLKDQACFVLLDEILRGTNSDDKREGTLEVIRKMANYEAYGGIATHDLEVCNVADEYPNTLTNQRFEVEIVNDELVFDYRLREGICENKSASFIMKKMGVI